MKRISILLFSFFFHSSVLVATVSEEIKNLDQDIRLFEEKTEKQIADIEKNIAVLSKQYDAVKSLKEAQKKEKLPVVEPNVPTPPPPPPAQKAPPVEKPKEEQLPAEEPKTSPQTKEPTGDRDEFLEGIRKGAPLKKPEVAREVLRRFDSMNIEQLKAELTNVKQQIENSKTQLKKRSLVTQKEHIELLISLRTMTVDQLKAEYKKNSAALVTEGTKVMFGSVDQEKIDQLTDKENLIKQIIKDKGGSLEEEAEETPDEWKD